MHLADAGTADVAAVEAEFQRLEAEANERLEHEGVSPDQITLERLIDMRYIGQWRSLAVAVSNPLDLEAAVKLFHDEHEREYNYRRDGAAVEIYQLNVRAIGITPKPEFKRHEVSNEKPSPASRRPVYFDAPAEALDTPVYDRADLSAGSTIPGPAIVNQLDATTVVPPGWSAEVDEWLNLRMSKTGEAQ
jgi:N-methylhydantoinase A